MTRKISKARANSAKVSVAMPVPIQLGPAAMNISPEDSFMKMLSGFVFQGQDNKVLENKSFWNSTEGKELADYIMVNEGPFRTSPLAMPMVLKIDKKADSLIVDTVSKVFAGKRNNLDMPLFRGTLCIVDGGFHGGDNVFFVEKNLMGSVDITIQKGSGHYISRINANQRVFAYDLQPYPLTHDLRDWPTLAIKAYIQNTFKYVPRSEYQGGDMGRLGAYLNSDWRSGYSKEELLQAIPELRRVNNDPRRLFAEIAKKYISSANANLEE
jgi:hypothetical protein